jgi:malate permease and related proteins
MLFVTSQMAALIVCGVVWRLVQPAGLDADTTRRVLTNVVYHLLLPALVLMVMWRAPLGLDSLRIAAVAASAILVSMLLIWTVCRACGQNRAVTGAMILTASFPNAVYLGLPVLESLFGDLGRSIAIQYDLFGCLPLLMTVGLLVARHYGEPGELPVHPLATLVRVPAIWAALAGISLNLAEVPMTPWLETLFSMLANGVTPLMLFSLGLALSIRSWRVGYAAMLLPVVVIQLFAMPLWALGLAHTLGLEGDMRVGTVLEAAMPSMVLGLVFCDRYRLDTSVYAAAVTVTTALSLVTLPLWYGWMS